LAAERLKRDLSICLNVKQMFRRDRVQNKTKRLRNIFLQFANVLLYLFLTQLSVGFGPTFKFAVFALET